LNSVFVADRARGGSAFFVGRTFSIFILIVGKGPKDISLIDFWDCRLKKVFVNTSVSQKLSIEFLWKKLMVI